MIMKEKMCQVFKGKGTNNAVCRESLKIAGEYLDEVAANRGL